MLPIFQYKKMEKKALILLPSSNEIIGYTKQFIWLGGKVDIYKVDQYKIIWCKLLNDLWLFLLTSKLPLNQKYRFLFLIIKVRV
jgi:hypothetical protein